jgi:putative addiction module component (TIGR02574 family)
MKNLSLSQILKLSVPKRIKLAQAVWDSVAQVPKSLQVTESERKELDRRLQSYYDHPGSSIPWSKVKAKLLNQA